MTDTVEEVADPLGLDVTSRTRCRQAAGDLFSGRYWLRHRDELGEFSEVLSGSCEVELVTRTVWTS